MLKITSLRNIKPCHYGSLLFIVQDITGPPRGFEWLIIFRELESTGNYFQVFGEQAHSFGDLGSPANKVKESHLLEKSLHFI